MSLWALPVLMYHHINPHKNNLVTITPEDFDSQMAYLAQKGYQTLETKEALSFLKGKKTLTGKEVLITFDDGFLDNWVYAYPILKKYGLRAVIFLATGFVEVKGTARPHIGQIWQKEININELPEIKQHNDFDYQAVMLDKNFGLYTRWSELAQMESGGVIDIQPHTHFHGEYFNSSRIIKFNSKENNRLALSTDGDSRLGIPIYKKSSAILSRRYYDDPDLRNHLAQYVTEQGNTAFLERSKDEWQKELNSVAERYIERHGLKDSYETQEEYERRVKKDLSDCKRLIEEKLNKKCLAIAWPWGAYNEQLLKWANDLGYQAAFTTERGANLAGCDLMRLKRCVVKKGDTGWFRQQLFIYSRPKIANIYLNFRGKGLK